MSLRMMIQVDFGGNDDHIAGGGDCENDDDDDDTNDEFGGCMLLLMMGIMIKRREGAYLLISIFGHLIMTLFLVSQKEKSLNDCYCKT